ncbi:MAG TPA: hypothetical protein VN106_10695 [Sphingomicrobium sp.]|jgi:hypothetical protein|nr:hypothetical protein [Sphingomicrobium sp.]
MIPAKRLLGSLTVASFIAIMSLSGSAVAAPQKVANQTQRGTLTGLNHSGASGTLSLQLRGNRYLTVQIDATGLEPGVPHVGHIHGLVVSGHPANSTCPTTAQDTDHDGYVELAEGQVTYGPILIPFGNVDPNMDGTVHFVHTYDLDDSSIYAAGFSKADVFPLDLREVVLHGMTLQAGQGADGGEADGTAGFKAVLPVTCGDIENSGRNPLHMMHAPGH